MNYHIPVLLNEVIENLIIDKLPQLQEIKHVKIFDGTLGGGGYSQKLLDTSKENNLELELFASDLDAGAIDRVKSYIKIPVNSSFTAYHANFAEAVGGFEDKSMDGICVDLGFSSNQLEISGRGFAYLKPEEPLDLRYDIEETDSCSYKLLHLKSADELAKALYHYSGEPYSRRIAELIYGMNKKTPWTVQEMIDVVLEVLPAKAMKYKNPTLSRVWQGLRIWTNDEFGSLEKFLPLALKKIKVGGRLAVVCFHSLEDKIVTNYFRGMSKAVNTDKFGNKTFEYKIITAKGILPSEQEVNENNRSRSAILRVIERI
jgi:16S rRNA (cytosine1402-N4)-methyltransferase